MKFVILVDDVWFHDFRTHSFCPRDYSIPICGIAHLRTQIRSNILENISFYYEKCQTFQLRAVTPETFQG